MTNLYREHTILASERISAVVEGVFTCLAEIRDRLAASHQEARARERQLESSDLAQLRPVLFEHLRRETHLVAGTGAIMSPGTLSDTTRWLEWWQSSAAPGGEPRFLDVDLDPTSVDFYDYTGADWFEIPERTGQRSIVGPYVDYGGTDEYMLTLTLPVITEGTFLGVAGADVPARRFEVVTLPILQRIETQAVLINAAGRVIASNTPALLAGSLLKHAHVTDEAPGSEGAAPATSAAQPCHGTPWELLVF